MNLKIALAVLVGILLGLPAGFYVAGRVLLEPFAMLSTLRAESRLGENTILLKLLDNGKVDAAKFLVLSQVQTDTILAAGMVASDAADVSARLFHYARLSGDLPSVRADTSEIGVMAAKARTALPPEPVAGEPKKAH